MTRGRQHRQKPENRENASKLIKVCFTVAENTSAAIFDVWCKPENKADKVSKRLDYGSELSSWFFEKKRVDTRKNIAFQRNEQRYETTVTNILDSVKNKKTIISDE
ncbi:hypothetical protein CDIK_3958 [Cucumispora dikerogammari]|nr:hypothetical protein CDIK_3958 [Cucumispora dikerogammari]